MRYHIDTIPVWDAMKLDGECLLCALERKTELGEAERYLGASVMEPDTRIQVNEKGFCPQHHRMLFSMSNRLGHALMLESHTAETRKRVDKLFCEIESAAKNLSEMGALSRLSSKGQASKKGYAGLVQSLREDTNRCIMCDSIQENLQRYVHTFFHLYQHDTEFQHRLLEGKGFCLPHAALLLEIAPKALPPKEAAAFAAQIAKLERENLDRIQEDISWFIKKFDYRYEKESWKNSRDAVERTVNKLRGWCVGDEPNPKE